MNRHIKSPHSTALCLLGTLILAANLLAFSGSACAYFTTYTFEYGAFGDTASPTDINDRGVIVWTGFGDGIPGGAAWVNGDFVNGYGAFGCDTCGVQVYDINNSGDLLGVALKNGVYVPTIWLAGVPYDLTDPANAGLMFQYDPGPKSVTNFDLWTLDVHGLPDFFNREFMDPFTDSFALTNARGDFVFAYGNGWNGLDTSYGILIAHVPEPATLALLGIGLAGLGFSRRSKP